MQLLWLDGLIEMNTLRDDFLLYNRLIKSISLRSLKRWSFLPATGFLRLIIEIVEITIYLDNNIMMKLIILIGITIALTLTEDIVPPTLPQFQHANLTRTKGLYQIVTSQRKINLINVPDVYQPTSYSCGPSSLRAVLELHSILVRESEVMAAAGTKPNKGTGPIMLETGFHKLLSSSGRNLQNIVSFTRKQGMTLSELQQNLLIGKPVIVLIQIFKSPTDPRSYKQYNDRGHYIVAIGMDDERLYFQDPKFYSTIVYINKSEFVDRWHDYLSTEERYANQVGIVVEFRDEHLPEGEQKMVRLQ